MSLGNWSPNAALVGKRGKDKSPKKGGYYLRYQSENRLSDVIRERLFRRDYL